MTQHSKDFRPDLDFSTSAVLPDPGDIQFARDALAQGFVTPKPQRNAKAFSWACQWFDVAFQLSNPMTHHDPRMDALRQVFAIIRDGQGDIVPSAVIALSTYPKLSRACALVVRTPHEDMGLRLQLAWLSQHECRPKSDLGAAFVDTPWECLDWPGWTESRDWQRKMMTALANDDLVTDIDGQFGSGTALRLGQRICDQLRQVRRRQPAQLTLTSAVMGSA